MASWPFGDVGNLYSTNKIVYVSPQFYGVDFGVSYEPNTGNVNADVTRAAPPRAWLSTFISTGGQGVASVGCDELSSTSTGDYQRRKNTYRRPGPLPRHVRPGGHRRDRRL